MCYALLCFKLPHKIVIKDIIINDIDLLSEQNL